MNEVVMYNKILVPIDLLEDSLNPQIIKHIEELAKLGSPEIHFLSVIPSAELFFGIEVTILPESHKNSAERSVLALKALEDVIKDINIAGERRKYRIEYLPISS